MKEDKKMNKKPVFNNNRMNNRESGKCCRKNIIFTDDIKVNSPTLSLGTTEKFIPINGECYTVIVPCRGIPAMQELLEVVITVDGMDYPLTDFTIGNYVYNDQIRWLNRDRCGNYVFRVVFGDNKPHFKIISQKLPRTLLENM